MEQKDLFLHLDQKSISGIVITLCSLSSLCVHCPHQCPFAFHISFFLPKITGAKRTKLNNKNVNMVVLNIFYGIFSSFGNSILAKI